MNKNEYMNALAHKLRRLPKEDFDNAMNYFYEYFEEAGPENEKNAIEDLGTADTAADQIVRDLALQNAKAPDKDIKKGFSSVWVGILAIFAAPIGLPLAFAFALVAVALIFVVIMLILSVFLAAFALIAAAFLGCFGGIILLFQSVPDGIATIGLGVFSMGIGIFVAYGSIVFCKWFLNKMTVLFGKLSRGGKKYAKNK